MNPQSVNDYETVWRHLMRLADRLGDSGKSDLPNRLPLSQLRVVGVIYDHNQDGIMLKEVADILKLTPGAISQTVDILVRENLIERTTSPTDRRAILLRPTPSGLRLKEQHTSELAATMQKISASISNEDFAIFSKVLAHLLEQMNKLKNKNNKQ